ncbi:hypothetical protein V2J09_004173 [Rumex salicifolius]
MPAHKRLQEDVDGDLPQDNGASYQKEEEKKMKEEEEEEKEEEEEEEEEGEEEEEEEEHHLENEDSDRSPSSSSDTEKEEFVLVKLSDVRKEVQCPICLGIIRKTRTVMECLHRFCRECIDKSMRMGNKECPACRTHCASRRSLRDDPNYDALIAAMYPDIDHYEEEELAFQDEDDARNKQIQASIAQTFKRQSEALTKKRKRSQSTTRRRASYRSDDDDANGNSSSADERPENRPKRSKRWKGRPSLAAATGEGGFDENESEANRDSPLASSGLFGSSDMLAWGRGGIRSHTRHGSAAGSNSKHARNNRLARLAEHLRNLDENDEIDIQIILVSLDVEKSPRLQQPYICCRPTLSVRQLCQFIAFQTTLQAEEVEILAVKELNSKLSSLLSLEAQPSDSSLLDASKDELQLLDFEDTLQGIKATFSLLQGHLILAYRPKSPGREACDKAVGGN